MRIIMLFSLALVVMIPLQGFLTTTAPAQVLIHEFVAKNVAGIKDEMGEYEDWIELVNLGSSAVDISDFYLTDDLTRLNKWVIPKGTLIAPGGTLLFWCDEDQEQGPYHTNFKLDKEGEEIALVNKDGTTIIDSHKFGQQAPDISQGRLVGFNIWVTFPDPTPRSQNQPMPCGNLKINGHDANTNSGDVISMQGPKVGQTAVFRTQNTPANTAGFFALAVLPYSASMGNLGTLLVNPAATLLFPINTNSSGLADFQIPLPNISALAGSTFYLQSFVYDGQNGGLTAGLITRICP